jgi:hypothetical protein
MMNGIEKRDLSDEYKKKARVLQSKIGFRDVHKSAIKRIRDIISTPRTTRLSDSVKGQTIPNV